MPGWEEEPGGPMLAIEKLSVAYGESLIDNAEEKVEHPDTAHNRHNQV